MTKIENKGDPVSKDWKAGFRAGAQQQDVPLQGVDEIDKKLIMGYSAGMDAAYRLNPDRSGPSDIAEDAQYMLGE